MGQFSPPQIYFSTSSLPYNCRKERSHHYKNSSSTNSHCFRLRQLVHGKLLLTLPRTTKIGVTPIPVNTINFTQCSQNCNTRPHRKSNYKIANQVQQNTHMEGDAVNL
ncbi:hypothetical protein M758_UG107500 [Ceratodon purpureus]|nr:hypothetical protein M758_UG107500 [Ceratodon purpureus]